MGNVRYNGVGSAGVRGAVGNAGKSDPIARTRVFNLPIVASGAAQTISGFTFPTASNITSAYINVIGAETVGASKTISVGLAGGGATDVLNAQSVAATGLFGASPNVNATGEDLTYTLGSADFSDGEFQLVVEYLECGV